MWTDENRAKYNRDHLRYPSDLTDEEWALVEPFIPPARRGGGKRRTDLRAVMNGVMYILRVRPKTSSWITKLPHHEADGREFQEREGIAVEIFPVLCKAATTVEPRNRAFYDPALG